MSRNILNNFGEILRNFVCVWLLTSCLIQFARACPTSILCPLLIQTRSVRSCR